MLLIPIPISDNRLSLLIVLEDVNIERIKDYDQAEIHWNQLPLKYRIKEPATIGIGYATPDEVLQITKLVHAGKPHEAVKLVTRKFTFKPEFGDHDHGPTPL